MPHFVIDCSENLTILESPDFIMQSVFDIAESTALFRRKDIKVRIIPFKHYNVSGTKDEFIHVFCDIRKGRTDEQKRDLSEKVVNKLQSMFPEVPVISMNIREFEEASYVNTAM